jgi:hypothetical protein
MYKLAQAALRKLMRTGRLSRTSINQARKEGVLPSSQHFTEGLERGTDSMIRRLPNFAGYVPTREPYKLLRYVPGKTFPVSAGLYNSGAERPLAAIGLTATPPKVFGTASLKDKKQLGQFTALFRRHELDELRTMTSGRWSKSRADQFGGHRTPEVLRREFRNMQGLDAPVRARIEQARRTGTFRLPQSELALPQLASVYRYSDPLTELTPWFTDARALPGYIAKLDRFARHEPRFAGAVARYKQHLTPQAVGVKPLNKIYLRTLGERLHRWTPKSTATEWAVMRKQGFIDKCAEYGVDGTALLEGSGYG